MGLPMSDEDPGGQDVHMFMAGLGTGLDPFRAFVEQRKFQKNKGTKVGPQTPFFGGRYSKQEKQKKQSSTPAASGGSRHHDHDS